MLFAVLQSSFPVWSFEDDVDDISRVGEVSDQSMSLLLVMVGLLQRTVALLMAMSTVSTQSP